jgi:endoglucanase
MNVGSVVGINENGLISDATVGGIDPRTIVSKPVRIGDNEVPGVIGAKAIHLQRAAERTQVLGHEQLYIDIGARDKSSAERLVSPGDFVTFDSEWVEFGDGCVKVRALDDRVGCNTMISALEGDYACDLTCAFTVQEEVGCRGAMTAGWGVEYDSAIVLEGAAANDMGMADEWLKVCRVGEGVAVSFMDGASIRNRDLYKKLCALAEDNGIAWQVKKFVSGINDAGSLQRNNGARATCVLSVPCRYIHSGSNVACFHDIDAQYQLVDAYLTAGGAF